MKKSIFVIMACVIVAVGIWFWFGMQNSLGGVLAVLAKDGVVLEVTKGQAEVMLEGATKTLNAPFSQEIDKGAKIKVLADSQADIIFSSGTTARLDSGTEVDLSDYVNVDKKISVKFNLLNGSLWSRVQRLLDLDSEYEVKTANTVAVVRGTAFNVSWLNNQTRVDVLDSTVNVAAIDVQTGQVLPGGQTDVEAGSFVQVDSASLPSAQKPLVPQAITPQDLQQPWYQKNLDNDKKIDGALANFGDNISRNQVKEILSAVVLLNMKTAPKEDLLKNKPADAEPSVSAAPSANVSPVVSSKPTKSPVPSSKPAPVSSPLVEQKLTVTGVSPVAAPGNGYQYTRLTIKGSGFSAACQIFMGVHALQNIKLVSSAVLEGTLGANISPAVYDISVACGEQKATLFKAFDVYMPKE